MDVATLHTLILQLQVICGFHYVVCYEITHWVLQGRVCSELLLQVLLRRVNPYVKDFMMIAEIAL